MTLNVGADPGVGQQEQEDIHNRWDTIDEVEFELTVMGFPPMEKPDFAPPAINASLYQALSVGDGRTLTYEHTRFAAWYSYAQAKLAHFKGRQSQTKNEMRQIYNRVKKQMVDGAKTAAEKKPDKETIEQEASSDPRYLQLLIDLQKIDQIVDKLEGDSKMFAAGKSLTSRTVEVRGQELEGLGGRRRYNPGDNTNYQGGM